MATLAALAPATSHAAELTYGKAQLSASSAAQGDFIHADTSAVLEFKQNRLTYGVSLNAKRTIRDGGAASTDSRGTVGGYLSYDVNDSLTIGAEMSRRADSNSANTPIGVGADYTIGKMTFDAAYVHVDSTGRYAHLGGVYDHSDQLQLAARVWRNWATDSTNSTTHSVALAGRYTADRYHITARAASIRDGLDKRLGIAGAYRFTDQISALAGAHVRERNGKSSHRAAFGVRYHINDTLSLDALYGVAKHDSSYADDCPCIGVALNWKTGKTSSTNAKYRDMFDEVGDIAYAYD